MLIEQNTALKFQKKDPNRSKLLLMIVIAVLLVCVVILLLILLFKPEDSKSTVSNTNSTPVPTSTISPTAVKTTTSITPKVTTTVTSVPTITITPQVTITQKVEEIVVPTSMTSQTFKDPNLDISVLLPAEWTAKVTKFSEAPKQCTDFADYFRSPCTGTFYQYGSFIALNNNSEQTTISDSLNIESKVENIPDTACTSGQKSTTFFVNIRGVRIDIPACSTSSGGFTGNIVNLDIAGKKSDRKNLVVSFNAKDRASMENILDILASVK